MRCWENFKRRLLSKRKVPSDSQLQTRLKCDGIFKWLTESVSRMDMKDLLDFEDNIEYDYDVWISNQWRFQRPRCSYLFYVGSVAHGMRGFVIMIMWRLQTRIEKSFSYSNKVLYYVEVPSFKMSSIKLVWRKTSFSWRISVDGRPNRRTKAAFSSFPITVWTGHACKMLGMHAKCLGAMMLSHGSFDLGALAAHFVSSFNWFTAWYWTGLIRLRYWQVKEWVGKARRWRRSRVKEGQEKKTERKRWGLRQYFLFCCHS